MSQTIAVRLFPDEYERVTRLANTSGLKIGQWLRVAIQERLSAERSASLTLVSQCFGLRLLLLNLLPYVGSEEPSLEAQDLRNLGESVDRRCEQEVEQLLYRALPGTEGEADSPAAVRGHQVGARVSETQAEEIRLAAQAVGITAAEWVRETIVTQLTREELLYVLAQQLLGLRGILDQVFGSFRSGRTRLDMEVIGQFMEETDPGKLQIHPWEEPGSRETVTR